jgi:putative ABC transport system permease protein
MIFKQAMRMLARDWRAGELRILAAALVVAVASVTSVAFFADRVSRALVRDAHQLLGADLVLVSDQPWRQAIADEIGRRGLGFARATTFISMVFAGDQSQLAGVKAVSENYPLRGQVWIEERLITALEAPVGSKLRLGSGTFEISAVITLEPERGANFFNIAPRLFMNVDDVPLTGLVQTGSRVWHYLYAAGPQDRIAALEGWVKQNLERGQRVDNLESGRPEVRAASARSASSASPRCWRRSSPGSRSRSARAASSSATWTAAR